jgi:UDP-2,3-diacylglucosamine pyrophosphatase LpxH
MYDILKFNIDAKNVYVCGDAHGEFQFLKNKIRLSEIENSIIIIAGDSGFGFEKPIYYKLQYNKMKSVLSKQNVTILFMRGNHDDPQYFNGDLKINYKYFKTISDYTILTFGSNNYSPHNVLCVGGAISIDRLKRIEYDAKKNRFGGKYKSYWDDEMPVYREDILNKIKLDNIKIDTIITHSSPSFAPLKDKTNIESFIYFDPKLTKDIDEEREIITKIYDHVVKIDKHPVKKLIYGHFHQHSVTYSDEDVKLIMLDCLHLKSNSWDIYPLER